MSPIASLLVAGAGQSLPPGPALPPGVFAIMRDMSIKLLVKKPIIWLVLAAVIALAGWLAIANFSSQTDDPGPGPSPDPVVYGDPVDDWAFNPAGSGSATGFTGGTSTRNLAPASLGVAADSASNIGLAVGGANDINNFRQNVASGYLPSPADISHEGIFYDYFFETGPDQDCQQLFCPAYATAVSPDPFSGVDEHFLAVGLNSNISADDFARKQLNLVVVLDISGSMSSSFDRYYYDQFGGQLQPATSPGGPEEEDPDASASKMEVAAKSLVALLDHLEPGDRLGIVLFDDQAYTAKPLGFVAETDLDALRGHVLELSPQGGTNMEAGYRAGTELLAEYQQADPENYENRIIFLTDAQPNLGSLDDEDLAGLTESNSEASIYTSFIGIGVDFNADLIRRISQTEGANYFAVHSSADFKRQLDEGFDYMVTPLVFDLSLKLDAAGYDIRAVYGSPEADLATGEIMKINTLFPSLRVDGQTRGGLVLLHLNKLDQSASLSLSVSYLDRAGAEHENGQTVDFSDASGPRYGHTGIHKGVVLSRLVNTIHDWLRHESQPVVYPVFDYRRQGIPIWDEPIDLSPWERTSQPLSLSAEYRSVLISLRDYLNGQIEAIGDDSLDREVDLINQILNQTRAN